MASGDRLTGLDSSFLHLEDGPAHMHVASTLVFEGPAPDYDRVPRAHPLAASPGAPVPPEAALRALWPGAAGLGGRPAVQPRLPRAAHSPPGARVRAAAAHARRPRLLPAPRPLEAGLGAAGWSTGCRGGRFAIVGKSHHCLVDGVSGMDITTVLFDTEPEPPAQPEPEPWAPGPEPSDTQVLGRALIERATTPAEAVRGVRALFRAPRQVAGAVVDGLESIGALARAGISAPASPFNVEISPYRRFAWVAGGPRRVQADQGGRRRHRERRRPRRRRRRARPVPARPRPRHRRPRAQGDGADQRAHDRRARRPRQPRQRDVRAAARGRRGSGGAPARGERVAWATSRSRSRRSARRS